MKSLLTAVFVILLATEVQAQCNKPASVEESIAENWNEQVVNVGVTQGGVVRLYVNRETGTWTLTMIRMQGTRKMECLMSSGDGWQEISDPASKGDPA